jgi:hypothetical protein
MWQRRQNYRTTCRNITNTITVVQKAWQSHVEAGYNTSTVALRVVRSDRKGTQSPELYLGYPVPGGYKYGDLAL